MPSYAITGASRGLGWAFLEEISNDSSNTVIGIVRDKTATDKRVKDELNGRPNITILQADITDYAALKKAAEDTSKITGGHLDYLIANAALVSKYDGYDGIGTLGSDPDQLTAQFNAYMTTNVLGNIHLYNLFMPLILAGDAKKVTAISTGMADLDLVNEFATYMGPLYAMSKAAMNMVTAKFSAQYKKEGVLFVSISPGFVDTGNNDVSNLSPEQMEGLQAMVASFQKYAPHFKGAITPQESVKAVLGVIDKLSLDQGHGGAFLSHLGTKQWL
ncbi:NAD(P)-binding protein [Westerdykella ornata]|uniref:NAD(P)-binding protein n=1 Tax=Westerdykella ornata TaxID=318751 RepID=A0A6A6J8C1_WESOR|nr:NAD(P)-binding protein [Westerdykella ornata]KAF2272615.1 NAD(P)-binding protein [Westerdykella ornata]